MKFITTHLITCFILVSIPHVTSLNFSYTFTGSQNPNREIVIEHDGAYSDEGIQLTPDRIEYGYGLTFFLAQNNSLLEARGNMGLPITSSQSAVRYRFVAVEFDTFWDSGWDPKDNDTPVGDHVGISTSGLGSPKYRKWFSNVTGGGVCQAWIRYDSGLKNLSVSFAGYRNNTVRQDGFSRVIDLRKELPEQPGSSEWEKHLGGTDSRIIGYHLLSSCTFTCSLEVEEGKKDGR
ncbi:hypothetical protein L1987_26933 [Smallanthus sonchifolius]|uniref:Uncharacterized protein n=1 Tax=Smallanthus sonchifolius TaxID=185202 RepID=A0ACB9IBY8_9ASTR|nr:hypothetical protein L1987_26933 [Smallanthus sonchifolius]